MVSLSGDYKKQSFFHLCRLETILFKKENLFSVKCGDTFPIRESINRLLNFGGPMLGICFTM